MLSSYHHQLAEFWCRDGSKGRKEKSPKAQNNCSPAVRGARRTGTQVAVLLLAADMEKQERWASTPEGPLPSPHLGILLWSGCALPHPNSGARHKQLCAQRLNAQF